ncbi:MAG: ribosome silencing factor [Terriglobia bacterium]
MTNERALEGVQRAATAAREKQTTDLVLLDLEGIASFTRYFLLCTGLSSRQVQAIADSVEEQLAPLGLLPQHVEGYENAAWVLLDYVDFVVHVFSASARQYYDLERLWRLAARLPLEAETPPRAVSE